MATTIDEIAASAVAALDSAYAANPNGDINQMVSDILAAAEANDIPAADDEAGCLTLASLTPDELIVTNTAVYQEINSNAISIVQNALNAEAANLQNNSGGGGSGS